MVIRVNISELESKAKYAESLSIQLKIKVDEINSIYYSLDPKVKSRNGIGQSMISLQKRIEEAQQKMYNISKFLYSAAENYRNAEEQIVSNSKRFEDSHRLYDEQYSDYNYIKNLNIFEGADIEGINSANNVEMDSRVIDYLKKSGNQLILGNYTEDVTLLGTLMQVGTGLLGVDLPMDLRDILYDFTHWKWSWEHAGKAGMDLLAVFPIIGGLKYTDEASSLAKAAFKNTDEASALMKGALKNTDEASTLIKGSLKSSDEISDIAKGVDETVEVATKGISKAIDIEEISKLLKTEPDTAFFWSGRTNGIGGADRAAEIAKTKGGVTLESTISDKNIKMPEWDFNNPDSIKAWEDASAEYAKQVSGEIRAVVGKELREGNIWENVELPRLKQNPSVRKITIIDPETGIEKIIFER